MRREEIEDDLKQALEVLKKGGIILYPTDTIWGMGCDATDSKAVNRLFELKRRPSSKAMISLVSSVEDLSKWLHILPDCAIEEIRSTDRPLTIIYDKPKGVSNMLESDDGSCAFRIPQLQFTKDLCSRLGHPLVSTSANFSGDSSPLSFNDINQSVVHGVDYVCKFGRDLKGSMPSKIIKISNNGEKIIIRE